MSTAISGRIALLRLRTSTPDRAESDKSTRATSNGDARTCAIASSPVRASPVTSMSTRPENTCLRPILTTSWSSTIRRRIMAFFPAGVVQALITARRPGTTGVGNDGFVCRNDPTPPALERVSEDNPVSLDGDIFPLQPRDLGHQLSRGLVDDASRIGVVAQGPVGIARGAALVLALVAVRGQLEVRLGGRRDK